MIKERLKMKASRIITVRNFVLGITRVSTKWLNILRKICAIFAQIFFANFCAIFLRNLRKAGNIFAKVAHETKF